MLPLGTVLLPSAFMPLHLFEERYRRMIVDVLATDREFGVVLIRRGSEVGGGDQRCDVGTRARVLEAREAPDGRWAVTVVGLQRIRVDLWLPDDPHPVADVSPMPDRPGPGVPEPAYRSLESRLRRLLALLSELGDPVPSATFDLADDQAQGTIQMAALGPFTSYDRQRLLEADLVSGRCQVLDALLADAQAVVDLRLGPDRGGDGPAVGSSR
ncbi:MAG: LON peptidase substrate-binding domain-containing protein [Actinomycetota bacterium]|nr:LON peptidase substrate-binding domain-containing protein [Actinomycetota bacterium]